MPDEDTTIEPAEGAGLPQVREAYNRERARAAELETQLAEAQAAQRENAFLRAGVDLDSKAGSLVAKAYDGELDTEAIRTFASDIPGALRGQAPPPTETAPPPNDGPTPEELEAARVEGALNGGGVPAGQPPDKPLGLDMMDAAFGAQGGGRVRPASGMSDRAVAAGVQVILNRAVAGDPEAVYKGADESWGAAKARYDRR